MSDEIKFTGWRANLWPIAAYELKKIIPMSLLLFCMLYDYSTVRVLKDTLIVNAKNGGETVIPFLKTFVVLPSALIFVGLYARLSAKCSKSTVFYIVCGFFAAFFFLFGNILFPLQDYFHMSDQTMEHLQMTYPRLRQLIAVAGLWVYSAFYLFSELWGNIGITVLFWQFANQITPSKDAKRHYVSFQSIANLALPLSAMSVTYFFTALNTDTSVSMICNVVTALTLCAMGLYYYINRYVLTDPRFPVPVVIAKAKTIKPGLMESLRVVLNSRYLIYIAFLVVAYGMTINFAEVVWKGMMKVYARDIAPSVGLAPSAIYAGLQTKAIFWTGISAILIATFGKGILPRLGWRKTALITPLGMLITSILFFGSAVYPSKVIWIANSMNMSVMYFGVMLGTLQQVFTKSAKYVLFDTTKEMLYIPLPSDEKVQGKAAVEVIGGRAGKSGASMLQAVLFAALAAKDAFVITPYIAVCSLIVIGLWFMIVNLLAVEYETRLAQESTRLDEESHQHTEHKKQ